MTPRLTLGHIAATPDERIANLQRAFENEPGPAGDALRWVLREWVGARAGLVAIREAVEAAREGADVALDSDELLEIVAEGLEVRDE